MLTVNIDVSDGLVNGSRGEVAHVVSLGEKATLMTLTLVEKPYTQVPIVLHTLLLFQLVNVKSSLRLRG